MKRFFNIIWALAAVAAMLTACHKDDVVATQPDAPEGYMAISVPITMPDMSVVETRGVDPDGHNIHRIALFCFDQFGMFISHVNDVELNTYSATSGQIVEALIPDATRRIHFVANQNTSTFDDSYHKGKSELEVMTTLEGSSGMMIYWGRYATEASTAAEFKEGLLAAHGSANNPIRLLRNQAKVSVNVESGVSFSVAGFAVVNTNAFGTVAPRHPELGFDFDVLGTDWTGKDFVTLPKNKAKLTPPADVDNAAETYVFETENTAADPVSVIIKGNDSKYYRAMLILDDEYKMVRRNHHYIINITGPLSYGSNSFAEALEAPATNNVWLSIDDEVNEVRNADYILGVDQTEVVILAEPVSGGSGYNYYQLDENGKRTAIQSNGIIELGYTFSKADGTAAGADGPEVNWEGGNTVATDWLDNQYNASGTKHYIGIKLNPISSSDDVQKAEGTILIKKGLLQRKIKVIVLKQQSFVPMWVTTQMYGGDTTPPPIFSTNYQK